jgi:hypothetical protein
MKKTFTQILIGIIVVFVLIQFIPYGRANRNPPVVQQAVFDSPRTEQLFKRSCMDCHSHETQWPAYSHVAPVSWLVYHDVEEARSKFNVSMWGVQKRNAGKLAGEEVREGEMPLKNYLLLHPNAKLNEQERAELSDGLIKTFGHYK